MELSKRLKGSFTLRETRVPISRRQSPYNVISLTHVSASVENEKADEGQHSQKCSQCQLSPEVER